jgi:2-polyprenyl-3-methyl-5-hydroxy-6-metoxy-1,4-benzoquinol methylase
MDETPHPTEPAPWTRERILEFVEKAGLKYQKVDLPFGISTPGDERKQAFELAFGDDLQGKSVLDVGSYLGAFCLEALRRGASRAVGVEISRRRIGHARTIAEISGLAPEYILADIDELELGETFDVCLCMNLLHHLRDPIRLLHLLSRRTRQRLVLEVASLGRHDRRRAKLGLLASLMLRDLDVIHVAAGTQSVGNQKYFFSKGALRRILDGHIKRFHTVELIDSELRDRFFVRATRLVVERMVVVAGPSSSGKTTLMESLRKGEPLPVELCLDPATAPQLNAKDVAERSLSSLLPANPAPGLVYHYETTRLIKYNMARFDKDNACGIMECAQALDVLIPVPTVEELRARMRTAKVDATKGEKKKRRREILERYDDEAWIREHYAEWLAFCEALPVERKRIFAVTGGPGAWRLHRLTAAEDLAALLGRQ